MLKRKSDLNDEIDLNLLFGILWSKKYLLSTATVLLTALAIFFIISLPNIYKSYAVVMPNKNDSASGAISSLSSISGLANFAGINIQNTAGVSRTNLAISTVRSYSFFKEYAKDSNLIFDLIAVKGWDGKNNTLTIDSNYYDQEKLEWTTEFSNPLENEVLLQSAYEKYLEAITIEANEDDGTIAIGFKHFSPFTAKYNVESIISKINFDIRKRDISKANLAINFLQDEEQKVFNNDLRKLIFEMQKEEIAKSMLANISEQYVFEVIDPPYVPVKKSEPSRGVMVIFATLSSFFLSCFLVLMHRYIRK